MNRDEILEALARRGVADPATSLDALCDVIRMALSLEEPVKIRRFGQFSVQHRIPTSRRHPKTREMVKVPAALTIRFEASPHLIARIHPSGLGENGNPPDDRPRDD